MWILCSAKLVLVSKICSTFDIIKSACAVALFHILDIINIEKFSKLITMVNIWCFNK